MSLSFVIPIDLNNNEIQNLVIHKLATDPTGGDLAAGKIWYNTSTNTIKYYNGTAVKVIATIADLADFITASSTDILTNKTINASNNTISNLTVAMLAAGILDTDLTSVSASHDTLASAKAIKAYCDTISGMAGALVYKGSIDCSTNPNYPSADQGHVYIVGTAGHIGGASGPVVAAGDMLICDTDSTAAGDNATVGSYWNIIERNIEYVLQKKTFDVGDGSNTDYVLTHSLNTRDVQVFVYDASTYEQIICDVEMTSVDTVTLTFATAPSSNAYRAVITG